MFESLVEPAISAFYDLYKDIEKEYFDDAKILNMRLQAFREARGSAYQSQERL